MAYMYWVLLSLSVQINLIYGHGYMYKPPARSTAWRLGFKTPSYHNDMGLFCGGSSVQHGKNGGKCGVCGDNYASVNKPHEPGPGNKYATGTIVESYQQGETIEITIQITAFHKGYYEFRLCENDVPQKGHDASIAVTQECLDKNLLKSVDGKTKFIASMGRSKHLAKLPDHVSCTACVLQWRYRTANNWGCEDGSCGSGRGPQEEFVGCADIEIKQKGGQSKPKVDDSSKQTTTKSTEVSKESGTSKPTIKLPTTTTTSTMKPTPTTAPTSTMKPAPATTPTSTMKPAPATAPTSTMKPAPTTAPTSTMKPAPATTPRASTKKPRPNPSKSTGRRCRSVRPFASPAMDSFCQLNCNAITVYCPRSHCRCSKN